MSRRLIRHIDPWSVAKTVFPLSWIVISTVLWLMFMLVGSMMPPMMSDMYDMPMEAMGTVAMIFVGLIGGFIQSVFITLFVSFGTVGYNWLASLGGGFEIDIEDVTSTAVEGVGDERDSDSQLAKESST